MAFNVHPADGSATNAQAIVATRTLPTMRWGRLPTDEEKTLEGQPIEVIQNIIQQRILSIHDVLALGLTSRSLRALVTPLMHSPLIRETLLNRFTDVMDGTWRMEDNSRRRRERFNRAYDRLLLGMPNQT